MGWSLSFISYPLLITPLKAATIGLPSHTTSKLLQTSQSHATHTVSYGIALVASLGSVSIVCTWTEITYMSLMTSFIRGRLMDRAVCRPFGA